MKKPTSHKVYPKTRSSSLLHDIFSHLFKNVVIEYLDHLTTKNITIKNQ